MIDLGLVLSSGRSGSTLLASMLNMHSRIHVPVELLGLYSWLPRRLRFYGNLSKLGNAELLSSDLQYIGQLSEMGVEFPRDEFVRRLELTSGSYSDVLECFYGALLSQTGKKIIVDKTPNSSDEFRLIHRLFPAAKIVHLVRDGRDVALSMMAHRRGLNYRNLFELANAWSYTNDRLAQFGAESPDVYTRIHYESLVAEPEKVLRHVCDFFGVSFEENMLKFSRGSFASHNVDKLSHHRNLGRPIMASNTRKWATMMDESDQALYSLQAGSTLRRFDYEDGRKAGKLGVYLRKLRLSLATAARYLARGARLVRVEMTFLLALIHKKFFRRTGR